MERRRLLLITNPNPSLFGTGLVSLLEERKGQLMIEKAADLKTAIEKCATFQPEVVIYFRETSLPEDEALLQELVSRHPTRVIQCTLEANQLMVYDKTRIKNATVEDLMSAVLK